MTDRELPQIDACTCRGFLPATLRPNRCARCGGEKVPREHRWVNDVCALCGRHREDEGIRACNPLRKFAKAPDQPTPSQAIEAAARKIVDDVRRCSLDALPTITVYERAAAIIRKHLAPHLKEPSQ